MKKLLPVILMLFVGCKVQQPQAIPLKNNYSNGNFEGISDKPKDRVWDNIIDFFSKSGLPIRILDKSSGLLISGEITLRYTSEDKKGNLVNPGAYVVVNKIQYRDGSIGTPNYLGVTGEWNVRIKDGEGGKTVVAVNLVNPKYTSIIDRNVPISFKQGMFQSTGVFENLIFQAIK